LGRVFGVQYGASGAGAQESVAFWRLKREGSRRRSALLEQHDNRQKALARSCEAFVHPAPVRPQNLK
jgi:hypothetical protein